MNLFTDLEKLKNELTKREGLKKSLTTGGFDVLHSGHELYLKDAKSQAEILIVLLQSDEMVHGRKSKPDQARPIFPAEERARQLFETKDYVGVIDYILVIKNTEDLYKTIEEIHPDILVLSESTEDDETSPKKLKERFGNEMIVNILPPKSKIHSSDIIKEKGLKPLSPFKSEFTGKKIDFSKFKLR